MPSPISVIDTAEVVEAGFFQAYDERPVITIDQKCSMDMAAVLADDDDRHTIPFVGMTDWPDEDEAGEPVAAPQSSAGMLKSRKLTAERAEAAIMLDDPLIQQLSRPLRRSAILDRAERRLTKMGIPLRGFREPLEFSGL